MLFREPGFSKEPEHLQLTPILIGVLLKNSPNWLPLPGKVSLFRDLTGHQKMGFSPQGTISSADSTSLKA